MGADIEQDEVLHELLIACRTGIRDRIIVIGIRDETVAIGVRAGVRGCTITTDVCEPDSPQSPAPQTYLCPDGSTLFTGLLSVYTYG